MVEETGRIKSYFLAHSQAGFQIDLVLLRLLLLELGERAGGDDVAIFGLVFARPVVLAPLGGDAGWDPVRRLRTALPSRLGSEVIVLDGGETSGEDRLPFLDTGIVEILARATGGIGVVLEHRYYGTCFQPHTLVGMVVLICSAM